MAPTFSHRSANGTNWYIRESRRLDVRAQYVTWDDLTSEERAAIVADRLNESSPSRRGTNLSDVTDALKHTYKGLIVKQLQMSNVLFEKISAAKQQLRATPFDQFAGIPIHVTHNIPDDQVWLMDPNGKAIKVDVIAGK